MAEETVFDRLRERFPDEVVAERETAGQRWLEVRPERIQEILAFLKESAELAFEHLALGDISRSEHD